MVRAGGTSVQVAIFLTSPGLVTLAPEVQTTLTSALLLLPYKYKC